MYGVSIHIQQFMLHFYKSTLLDAHLHVNFGGWLFIRSRSYSIKDVSNTKIPPNKRKNHIESILCCVLKGCIERIKENEMTLENLELSRFDHSYGDWRMMLILFVCDCVGVYLSKWVSTCMWPKKKRVKSIQVIALTMCLFLFCDSGSMWTNTDVCA